MTPSVPSLPSSSWTRSYPVLSFGSPFIRRHHGAVREHRLETRAPASVSCPCRSTRAPPAFVATTPPTSPSRGRRGRRRARARPSVRGGLHGSSGAPASASIVPSRDRGRRRRAAGPVLSTTSPSAGEAAPTSPVLPPCGTSGTPAPAQAPHDGGRPRRCSPDGPRRAAARSSAPSSRGRSRRRASPVSTCASPTAARSRSTSVTRLIGAPTAPAGSRAGARCATVARIIGSVGRGRHDPAARRAGTCRRRGTAARAPAGCRAAAA